MNCRILLIDVVMDVHLFSHSTFYYDSPRRMLKFSSNGIFYLYFENTICRYLFSAGEQNGMLYLLHLFMPSAQI